MLTYHINRFGSRLKRLGQMSDEAWEAFASCMSYYQLDKDEVLIKQGEIEDKVNYIVEGGVRIYVTLDDREVCTNFRFEDQFTSSITSFLLQRPSQYSIKTLMPSKFLMFSHQKLYWLYDEYVELNTLGRVLIENLLIEKRQRELDFLRLDAEERYIKLLEEQPKYAMELPLKYVASFLGITPQSLSRVRSVIMSKRN